MDYKNPDYTDIFRIRLENLHLLEADPEAVKAAKLHYSRNPWDFIDDWGMTIEPRNVEVGMIPDIPFILWPRQREFLQWMYSRWQGREQGLVEKSRDFGLSWLSIGFCCSMWLFRPGFSAGFGSALESLVDSKDDPGALFPKMRYFISQVPSVFMPDGFNMRVHSPYMKLINPETGANITGQAGDNIGRGDRKSIYIVDEAAFVRHQMLVDNALSNTTNCQIDISTYNGTGNQFYVKSMKFHGTERKFVCDWHDDPRKDDAWYAKMCEEKDESTVAQEIDRDPAASAKGSYIPAKYVRAAKDLHKRLGWEPTGIKVTAFDPSDVGDPKGTLTRHGFVIVQAELKTDGDIRDAIPWAYNMADEQRAEILRYDADGMGAPTMKLTLEGFAGDNLTVSPYYGSGAVENPTQVDGMPPDQVKRDKTLKQNKNKYVNYRAQQADNLYRRFAKAYEVSLQLDKGIIPQDVRPDEIISIDSSVENYFELEAELSRPMKKFNGDGKIRVESKKEMLTREIQSPTFFDCAKMAFATTSTKRQRVKSHEVRARRIGRRDRGLMG